MSQEKVGLGTSYSDTLRNRRGMWFSGATKLGPERKRATLYKRHQTWGERKQFRWHGKCQMNACNRGKGLLPGNARGGRERRSVCRRRRRSERRGGRPLLPSSPQSKAEQGWQGRRRGREGEGGSCLPGKRPPANGSHSLLSRFLKDCMTRAGPLQGGVVLFGDQHDLTN